MRFNLVCTQHCCTSGGLDQSLVLPKHTSQNYTHKTWHVGYCLWLLGGCTHKMLMYDVFNFRETMKKCFGFGGTNKAIGDDGAAQHHISTDLCVWWSMYLLYWPHEGVWPQKETNKRTWAWVVFNSILIIQWFNGGFFKKHACITGYMNRKCQTKGGHKRCSELGITNPLGMVVTQRNGC